MKQEHRDWLQGTLPSWVATGLLALSCWLIVRFIEHVESSISQNASDLRAIVVGRVEPNTLKIAILEEQTKYLTVITHELRDGQRETVTELKAIRMELKK